MNSEGNELFNFISRDVAASSHLWPLRCAVVAIVVLIPLLSNLFFGHNEALNWGSSLVPWSMVLFYLTLSLSFSRYLGSTVHSSRFSFVSSIVVVLLFLFPQFAEGFLPSLGDANIGVEAIRCLAFGFVVGGLTAVSLATAVFRYGPVPSASLRKAMSQLAGLAGAVGLFFKCPTSDYVHLLSGHGVQLLSVFLVTQFVSNFCFKKIVEGQLGRAANQFANIGKFDK
jgi:hypothetical protein